MDKAKHAKPEYEAFEYDIVAEDSMDLVATHEAASGRTSWRFQGESFDMTVMKFPGMKPEYRVQVTGKPRKKNTV